MVERYPDKIEVPGSIPGVPTKEQLIPCELFLFLPNKKRSSKRAPLNTINYFLYKTTPKAIANTKITKKEI